MEYVSKGKLDLGHKVELGKQIAEQQGLRLDLYLNSQNNFMCYVLKWLQENAGNVVQWPVLSASRSSCFSHGRSSSLDSVTPGIHLQRETRGHRSLLCLSDHETPPPEETCLNCPSRDRSVTGSHGWHLGPGQQSSCG